MLLFRMSICGSVIVCLCGVGKSMGGGPPVRNDIVTPRHLYPKRLSFIDWFRLLFNLLEMAFCYFSFFADQSSVVIVPLLFSFHVSVLAFEWTERDFDRKDVSSFKQGGRGKSITYI